MKLTAKEEEIMSFFWDKGPLFVRELLDCYSQSRPHFNTLSTIVRSLEEKGFLDHKAFGNSYQYFPVVSREEFSKSSLNGVIRKYYSSSAFSAVSSLIEEEAISLSDLKKLITEVERRNG
ncbi:MAG TPA: BlaI/MecI/CopY family transcriptional regulator [Bacteroidales bacterium]|jgi:predicted transcriptional regulator|nr:BlaI/MecI/CopY family transcriptional regulator [Bacteroidales bacterium]HOQ96518.1 BlaI/MecI/CopY family transcriptional regulator [Bacteroidales bacterium]HPA43711.1 BlaI/MecI/CopY family transcriptional regulator [Bacteroidales bacterium]HPL84558.1 BlaI/MecI/CopY family transcriptional regulator [Bacteroidales bacterium]HQB56839.1 BlaI/MecI/CopY family transcriptional regulator [Bacteroidales bacterium]